MEANRERFDRLIHQLAHGAGDDTRVNSPAEHCSQRHISHHTFLNGSLDMLPNALDILLDWAALSFAKCKIPVAFHTECINLAEQPVTRKHLVDIGKEGRRTRNIAHTKKIS